MHVAPLAIAALLAPATLVAACGGGSRASAPAASRIAAIRAARVDAGRVTTQSARTPVTSAALPMTPVVRAPRALGANWAMVATVGGEPAAWAARREGVTLVRFDQRLVHLVLHAGSEEPAEGGWHYGSQIGPNEAARVVAGFNGGFKLSSGSVGYMADGRVAVPLTSGLGSIVTYRDRSTQIGAWRAGVPTAGHGGLESVLQNRQLLVAQGRPAATVSACAIECWGATLGGAVDVARSALGITASGELVWGAGERLSPAELAAALAAAGVQSAVELDINPEWVAGYLYRHGSRRAVAIPLVPEQPGIPGQLLAPYNRDFFTVLAG